MKISELFRDDIHRDIRGVITVGRQDEAQVEQEMREYVVTRELDKHFRGFQKAFCKALDGPTEKIGVWVSGFFGSGKSHFLKMLAYLLENHEAGGKTALEYFGGKFDDPLLAAELGRIAKAGSADVIIFNIDAKASSDSKSDKEAVVRVLLNVFNEKLGYSARHPAVADLERKLDQDGTYDAFKAKYREFSGGNTWDGSDGGDEGRDTFDFDHDLIVRALTESGAMKTRKDAEVWHERASTQAYEISIEKFATVVRKYCDSKGKSHRVVFLIDEVGQYIGGNPGLMLNLQTVAEEFGDQMKGRAWLIVTAQEAIDAIIKGISDKDFSKIQGRFSTRLNLSSSNTDEVIRRRILVKTPVATKALTALYADKSAVLRNAVSFSAGTAELKAYASDEQFVACYPFIPYQFTLMQKVFEQIRRMGETGKHLSEGERSMLSAFQEAAKAAAGQPIGVLVPLSRFYDSLEAFLDGSVRRVIDQARENGRLTSADIEVLKTLFMVKHVKEVPKNLENLTTLQLDGVDADKIALRQSIADSLDRLAHETLIQKNGDEFIFLDNDEQEVGRGIKNTDIDDREVVEYLAEVAFDELYGDPKLKFRPDRSFPFDRRFDAVYRGKQGNPLVLAILSPLGDGYDDDATVMAMRNMGGGTAILKLPEGPYQAEATGLKRTEKYLRLNESRNNTATVQGILAAKRTEMKNVKDRIQASLSAALADAEVFVEGARVTLTEKSPKERMTAALMRLAETVFSKFDLVDVHVTQADDVRAILKANDVEQLTIDDSQANRHALDEMRRYLERQAGKNKRVTLKDLLDEFGGKPYGWSETDIQALLATLLVREVVHARHNSAVADRHDRAFGDAFTKNREAERIIIELRVQIDAATLNAARLVLRELTGAGDWPDREGEFYAKARDAVRLLLDEVKKHEARHERRNYPGRAKAENARKALDALVALDEPATFFAALRDDKADLQDAADDIAQMKGFFSGQVAIWDEAVDKTAFYAKAEVFLDGDARKALNSIRDILAMPSPYGRIQDLPPLVDRVGRAYDGVLQHEKKKAASDVQNHLKTGQDYFAAEGFGAAEATELLRPLCEVAETFASSADINQVKSLAASINEVYNRVLDEAARRKHPAVSGSAGADTPSTNKKRVKSLHLTDIVAHPAPIRSEADIEDLLCAMRVRLVEVLADTDEIRLS